ncbi:RNA-guided endonuclease InsQ/TnpB family protein [Streptomyces sp. KL116D]|uniref:RNA-guided endonuclease InsQ/TnpB family protein n=1 Tax=Streptomyces sp. KL116D TaxID=3045152 RepID=UPI0035580E87
MTASHVKRAFKYRFYPTDEQAAELSRTFGCVRKVYNMALAARTEAWVRQERVNYNATSAMLTAWKKTEELASLDIVWSRLLPEGAAPSTVTVSQDAAGRWFVSLLCEDPTIWPLPANGRAVGVDVGLNHLLTLSTGEKIAKIYARIADRRRDGLHKLTGRLVRENQTIVIEDLTVRNMVRNRSLARAISDAAWSQFRGLLEYKADWYGREVIAVDRFFPSSKLCSTCGTLQERMPLHVRTWTCDCGTTHDRDVNAAKNLLAAGLAVSACGAGVRPQRSSPDGQSAMKQEASRREPRSPRR